MNFDMLAQSLEEAQGGETKAEDVLRRKIERTVEVEMAAADEAEADGAEDELKTVPEDGSLLKSGKTCRTRTKSRYETPEQIMQREK
jgi:hypothetical protein